MTPFKGGKATRRKDTEAWSMEEETGATEVKSQGAPLLALVSPPLPAPRHHPLPTLGSPQSLQAHFSRSQALSLWPRQPLFGITEGVLLGWTSPRREG